MTPIPSSPIAQKQPKIGTRYIAVSHVPMERFPEAWHAFNAGAKESECRCNNYDTYMLLDPTDAAELERLRKVEDEAADAFDRRLEEEQDGSYSIPVNEWSRWRSAREARIAFEAKIGGGV